VDFDRLLEPISVERPTGENVREDASPASLYYAIKDARNSASRRERGADESEEPFNRAREWQPVVALARQILTERAKDLEVAAWYIEALLRTDGFAGLRDGFRLTRGLVERFWDGLFPMPDEEGLATRVYPMTGLNGEGGEGALVLPIRKVPITEGQSAGPFATWQYEQAREVGRYDDAERRERRIQAGAVSIEMFNTAVAETRVEFFRDLRDDLTECLTEFQALTRSLDERCGPDSPPSSSIRAALEACLGVVNTVTRDILVDAGSGAAEGQPGESRAAGGGAPPQGAPGSREEALRLLLQVSDFFRRTEPHSPVSYALDQAVRWGRMSLPDLWTELITDQGARGELFRLTGIRPPQESS
jgi:type VI secretion system protein ImpA